MTLNNNAVAIYQQIIDRFMLDIASGKLAPGSRIDSIRVLAIEFKVNPNTVQKALNELERDGYIETDRTKGKFVTDNVERITKLKHQITESVVKNFVDRVRALGLNEEEVIVLYNRIREERK